MQPQRAAFKRADDGVLICIDDELEVVVKRHLALVRRSLLNTSLPQVA